MNDRNNVAFPSSGKDCSNVLTSLLILDIALILLRGLRALSILRDFKFTLDATKSVILFYSIMLIFILPCYYYG